MWSKLHAYFKEKQNKYRKERYLELLAEIDHPSVGIEHLPIMLVTFWKQFDVTLLKTISDRDWMYITLVVRHNNIAELIYAVQDFTNAIAQDNYGIIELASKERFKTAINTDLDAYLSGLNGEIIDPMEAFKALKANIIRHGDIIETIRSTAHIRFLHRFYKDIHELTLTLVNNIKA